MFEYFTDKAIAVVMSAQEEARRLGHNLVGTEQILLGLLNDKTSIAAAVLTELGITLEATRTEVTKIIGRGSGFVPTEIPFTPKTKKIFEQALQEAHHLSHNYIGPEHILLSLTQDRESVAAKVLQNLGADLGQIRTRVIHSLGAAPVAAGAAQRPALNRPSRKLQLEEFGTNLTQMAIAGELDPVIGRDREIERVVQILGRRTKNNPVLIGEPGVGKTAIAEGLAQRIANQDVPEELVDKQIFNLDMGRLLSGTRFRGDFEERLKKVVEEVQQAGNIILVIDELHTLVGAGSIEGGMDAANLLKPALARGTLQCLGATTLDEYRKHIERDAALERRFQPIRIEEPSVEDTLEILKGVRIRYEQHHQLTITDAALEAAAIFSDRYIPDRYQPDKAIDLIDEAGSRVRLQATRQRKLVDPALLQDLRQVKQALTAAVQIQDFDKAIGLRDRERELEMQVQQAQQQNESYLDRTGQTAVEAEDIAQVVSAWTSIPVQQLTESESALLMHLEETLHERLVGQEEAVTAVARAIRRARVGLNNPDRPIASLIFSGPTGVGKTELTKALAASVFGSESAMIRLDMSEYMERHTVSKLIGSPPGFVGYDEGGQLTEAVRRQPYAVLLLDEIEKAHPDVFNLLLQILEDGRLTDAKGRTVSFKNTLLIMTSNIGSRVIEKGGGGLGFEFSGSDQAEAQYDRIRNLVNEELKQHFRPEFLNRLDEVIVFRQLSRDEVKQIADILVQEVAGRLAEQGIQLQVTEAFKDRLVTEGFDPSYGARPLRRAIARLIEDQLAEAMLAGQLGMGDTALIDIDDDGQVQVRSERSPELVGASQR